jgi:hypothetical protein
MYGLGMLSGASSKTEVCLECLTEKVALESSQDLMAVRCFEIQNVTLGGGACYALGLGPNKAVGRSPKL